MRRYYFTGNTRVAMRSGSTLKFLLGDHPSLSLGTGLGSTSITTNSSGVFVAEQKYYPWGTIRYSYGSIPTTFQFTGQRVEGYLGLYYYGARWYDNSAGRFIQPDTIIPEKQQGVQAWDRYAYTSNNPIRYTDPNGHCIFGLDTAICIYLVIMAITYISENAPEIEQIISEESPQIEVSFNGLIADAQPLIDEAGAKIENTLEKVVPTAGNEVVNNGQPIEGGGRPDLYRGGSQIDPNFNLRTPQNPYSNGTYDISPNEEGIIKPGEGGLSTSTFPKTSWKYPWQYPSTAPNPEGIKIFQDNPFQNPDHWLWEPAWEMTNEQFLQYLKNTLGDWVQLK